VKPWKMGEDGSRALPTACEMKRCKQAKLSCWMSMRMFLFCRQAHRGTDVRPARGLDYTSLPTSQPRDCEVSSLNGKDVNERTR